jgi:regulator of RNase E activity RraA
MNTAQRSRKDRNSHKKAQGPLPEARGPLIQTDESKTLPPPLELQQRYLALQTADVNGGLSQLQEETQLLDLRIKPLRCGMRCAGLAVTWHAVLANTDPVPRAAEPYSRWTKVWEHIYPGCILVYQPGGEMSSGHLGNLYSNMVRSRGAMGAIVDGNIRDSDGHARIKGWNPFARGASPLEAAPHLKWLAPNTPILMSGELRRYIAVHPGDMVMADGDGVIIVPKKLILPALLKAEEIRRRETPAEKAYAAGENPDEVQKKYGAA